jgi:hypothetical protein
MRRAAAALVVLGLALVGCGDDSETDQGAATTVPRSPIATTTTTVRSVTPTTGSSATSTTVGTLQCETVAFTPNSEDAASDVTATGLSCSEAEAFVREAGMQTSSGGPSEVDVQGYHCVRTRTEQDPLPRSYYECTNGPKTVTFVRS